MIIVTNRGIGGKGAYIGKGSVWHPTEFVDNYYDWAIHMYKDNAFFRVCFDRLLEAHTNGEDVELDCSCGEDDCHGYKVTDLIEATAFFGKGFMEGDE